MRAWQVQQHGAPRDALRRVDLAVPEPAAAEVRLRVRAAAIGLPDALMCRDAYAFKPALPFVPGQEVCGIVDAVGEGVDIALGTRLMAVTSFRDGHGGFADFALAPLHSTFRAPDTMPDADAACFRIGYSTAWIGLVRRGALRAGETLLVLGAAGGSGISAVEVGHALGARVIAVASGATKTDLCRAHGADIVIDRRTTDVIDAVRDAVGRYGVDVIYDPVGGAFAASTVRLLAPGGRLLAVGFASGSWVPVDAGQLVRQNASVVGVYVFGFTREEQVADHEALLALAADGRLPGASRVVTFEDLPAAVDEVDRGDALGKLVVDVAIERR